MSQDSMPQAEHRTEVTRTVIASPGAKSIDPAARTGKRAYNALSASSIGLELGLSVAIGLLAGYYLDKYLGTTPWMLLLWMVLGVVAGFRGVFRAIKRADRAAAEESHPLGNLGEVATTEARRG
jgi:ATP synthase protein I